TKNKIKSSWWKNIELASNQDILNTRLQSELLQVMSKTYTHQDCEKTIPSANHQNFVKCV
ncbi:hypothetical protein BpHYR1_026796, partial [Brachionus plicatilis]